MLSVNSNELIENANMLTRKPLSTSRAQSPIEAPMIRRLPVFMIPKSDLHATRKARKGAPEATIYRVRTHAVGVASIPSPRLSASEQYWTP